MSSAFSAPCPVLIPFREPWNSVLLDHDIGFEVRRLRCGTETGSIVVMYCSTTKRVEGTFIVGEALTGPPDDIWALVGDRCGLLREEFDDWFGARKVAHAFELTAVRRVAEPFPLGFACPRSFAYLDEHRPEHARVLDLALPS